MEMSDHQFDQEVRSRLRGLDDTYPRELAPPGELWEALSGARRRRQTRTRMLWSAAASIAVLVLAGWWWQMPAPTKPADSVAALPDVISVQEQDALNYVIRLCQGNNVVCASEDFQALEDDLAASAKSLDEVSREMVRFGGDERLLRARERIKDQQAGIIRAMVQML